MWAFAKPNLFGFRDCFVWNSVFLVPRGSVFDELLSNLEEVKARRADHRYRLGRRRGDCRARR